MPVRKQKPGPTFCRTGSVPAAAGLLVLLCLPLLYGCGSLAKAGDDKPTRPGNLPASSAGLPTEGERSNAERNLLLSEGYAQLYEATGSLQYLDEALLLKVESDELDALASDAADYFAELRGTLEQLGKDYPGIDLTRTGLPVLEQKKREAAALDRLKSFVPITGSTGKEFERTLLLTLSGAFNQLQFLAMVMQEEEKSDERVRLLQDIEARVRQLYERDVQLLESRYFVQ